MHFTITIICIIASWSFFIQDLDALKSQASFRNQLKRRSKRQDVDLGTDAVDTADDYQAYNSYDRSNIQVNFNASSFINFKKRLDATGLTINDGVSVHGFIKQGLCYPSSHLLTNKGFSLIQSGHVAFLQMSTLNLFPVASVTTDDLVNAGYVTTSDEGYLLTALCIHAVFLGHISIPQLKQLNLYPLTPGTISTTNLIRAGYINRKDGGCWPTALSMAATHIRYMDKSYFSSSDCQPVDNSDVSASNLAGMRYTFGAYSIVTPIGLAALRSGFVQPSTYERLNAFPFRSTLAGLSTDDTYTNINQVPNEQPSGLIRGLVQVGYLSTNKNLITDAAYAAIQSGYFKVDHFRALKLWPCPNTLTINDLIRAGYVALNGHLTQLGHSLLYARYFSMNSLYKIGVHLPIDSSVFYHAFSYSGALSSDYQPFHANPSLFSNTNPISDDTLNVATTIPVDSSDGQISSDAEQVQLQDN